MIKLILLSIFLIVPTGLFANTGSLNLALPGSVGSYQSDTFRADGMDCSMAIGSSTNVEFGVVGIIDRNPGISTDLNNQARNIGVYGRITIPVGAPKDRLDCNTLYQLELRKKRVEVEKLEEELRNLKKLRFENQK